MNFILNRGFSRKDSIKSTSIMSCDSSSSSSSSSSGCCSNLSSSTAQVSGGEEVTSSPTNINNKKKSISSFCHSKGGAGNCSITSTSHHQYSSFPDHNSSHLHHFSNSDLNSSDSGHGLQSSLPPSRSPSIPSSSTGSISSSTYLTQSDNIEFGPMGTIKKKSSSASTHLNGPVLPLTSITRALAKHSNDDDCLVELIDDNIIKSHCSGATDICAANGNLHLQSSVQYGTLKMRRSFRVKGTNVNESPSYNGYTNGFTRHQSFRHQTRTGSQLTSRSSDCSSLASHPVTEEEEEEMSRRRVSRDSNGTASCGNFDEADDGQSNGDNLPLPPPPPESSNLTSSLSCLSLISLPPPPPEFSCNTIDTNTLSSTGSSSSPSSSSSSTATHSLDRSCCSGGADVTPRDNTLTRTNVRLHQERQKNSQHHQRQSGGAVCKSNCCPQRSSLSPSSASSSSYDEDISCDGRACSQCTSPIKSSHKTGAVDRYQLSRGGNQRVNGHNQEPCCSKSGGAMYKVRGANPVSRSVSCCNHEVGVKNQKLFFRAGSREDSSSSHISPHHPSRHLNPVSNPHPNELINARRYKAPVYSSSSSCSSRDGEDQSCSLKTESECQSPEDVTLQRLQSQENVNCNPQQQVSQLLSHKTLAQMKMKAKIAGLNRSEQPIYDSVFTYRKPQSQAMSNLAMNESDPRPGGIGDDIDELPLPPPPPELASIPNDSNQISNYSQSNVQALYEVVNKAGKRNQGNPDSSFNHPVPNRSPMKGPLPPPKEEFERNLHRVMEKKWKVAQTLSGDFDQFEDQILTSSFETRSLHYEPYASSNQVMGFRDSQPPPPPSSSQIVPSHNEPLPPPPPSHHHAGNGNHHAMIDSTSHVPAPPALTCLQPFQYNNHGSHQQPQMYQPHQQQYPQTDMYDVLPIAVRPFNRAINQAANYDSYNNPSAVSRGGEGNPGHAVQSGPNPYSNGSPHGINHRHWNHPENGSSPSHNPSSSPGLFSRMIPFRRSSKVSSVCSSNSSASNYSSSSSGVGGGSKAAPPPPPKRSDKTKLSQKK